MLRALDLLPLTTSLSSSRRQCPLSLKPSPASLIFSSAQKPYSKKFPPSHFPPESTTPRSSINGEKPGDSAAFDEDGVIDDMDGYLNRMSPEFNSVWDTKPSWCQPWTIVLTGVVVIASSWIWLHSTIISAVVSCLVSAWWYIFLYSYPKVDVYDRPQPEKRSETMKMGKDEA